MPKLTSLDREAIREFEEITLQEEIKREMTVYNKKNPNAKLIPWRIHFEKHEDSIIEKIKKRFNLSL